MSWRGRGKGSSDMVRRGSAFRTTTETFDPFDETLFPISAQARPLTPREETLVNYQRLLVNYLLAPGDDMIYLRVPLGNAAAATKDETSLPSLWKRLSAEIGDAYYPAELMSDSRAALLGISRKKKKNDDVNVKSLAALENSEGNGEASPKSNDAEEEEEAGSDDDSLGGEDYKVRFDFEDEGAREDDYEEERGGGDGDEF